MRDKFGNVVEGSPDTIQRVYYFWGLQQVGWKETCLFFAVLLNAFP